MKSSIALLSGLLLLICFSNCNQRSKSDFSEDSINTEQSLQLGLVERGEYLVRTIGCDHCHTPKKLTAEGPVPDMTRWLMGYPSQNPLPEINKDEIAPGKWVLFNGDLTAAVGPWGVSFSGNLTPHQTGLGNWTFDQFKKAMTQGKFKGLDNSRLLMPPMPWQSYSEMKEEDLNAIFEYLKTIKPIENIVPNHIPPNDL
jgi:hypothetical protein